MNSQGGITDTTVTTGIVSTTPPGARRARMERLPMFKTRNTSLALVDGAQADADDRTRLFGVVRCAPAAQGARQTLHRPCESNTVAACHVCQPLTEALASPLHFA